MSVFSVISCSAWYNIYIIEWLAITTQRVRTEGFYMVLNCGFIHTMFLETWKYTDTKRAYEELTGVSFFFGEDVKLSISGLLKLLSARCQIFLIVFWYTWNDSDMDFIAPNINFNSTSSGTTITKRAWVMSLLCCEVRFNSSSPHEEGLQWSHHQKRAYWRVLCLELKDPRLSNFKIKHEHSNCFAQIWCYTSMNMFHCAVQVYHDVLVECLSRSKVKFSVGSF